MKTLAITLFLGATLLFTGCSDSITAESGTTTVLLNVGESSSLSSGDTIQEARDAKIEISHNIETDIKTLTVLEGTVTLVKGNYNVQ